MKKILINNFLKMEKEKNKNLDLRSSVAKAGKVVTQILHFSHGNKRTISGILTNTIKQGEFTKFQLLDGRMVMINTANVDMIEIFKEE